MNIGKSLPSDVKIENDDQLDMDFGASDILDNHMDDVVVPEESQ